VPNRPRTRFVELAADIAGHATYIAVSLESFCEMFTRQVRLFGWDFDYWYAWQAEARAAVEKIRAAEAKKPD
jgi:hypothetical protein